MAAAGKPFRLKAGIVPRLYQQKIFMKCIKNDTLVVLPTGLGKTLIAIMVALQRLNERPGSKVVVLAPTKPLVTQHEASFRDSTTIDADRICALTGDVSPEARKETWDRGIVIVMTPQTLQHDLETGRYDLADVSLLVFDEAHRAVGNYSYVPVAEHYVSSALSPRVLALTASPGVGEEKIKAIMDNLHVSSIEVRDEEDPDVAMYIEPRKVRWVKLDLPDGFREIIALLNGQLDKVVRFLKENGLIPEDGRNVTRKDLLDINSKVRFLLDQQRTMEEKAQYFRIIKILAVGLRLSHALELVETQGLQALEKYVNNSIKEASSPGSSQALGLFAEVLRHDRIPERIADLRGRGMVHPKLEKLSDVLSSFMEKNPDSRILVFANYRVTVSMIVKYLKDNGFDKVSLFTGQGRSGSKKGMSRKEQLAIIEKFRSGEIMILVSTSVAEEGLDIGECDLVVCYDVVPSAIRSIQRRGRTGRKRGGEIVVLMAKGTRDEGYYYSEKKKEERMKKSLASLRKGKQSSVDGFLAGQEP